MWDPEDDLFEDAAESVAERKVEVFGDALKFALVAIALLVFVWPLGVIALILFGPRHLRRIWQLVFEPELRERFLREEIERRVRIHLAEERRRSGTKVSFS